jgi:hypothetical protein
VPLIPGNALIDDNLRRPVAVALFRVSADASRRQIKPILRSVHFVLTFAA